MRENDHSRLSSVEVENGGAVSPFPHTSLWRGVSFIKRRHKFAFYIFLT
jgi:hypothetical protein